jgi:predicted nucleic acid-binding protein
MICLDTNAVIAAINKRKPNVRRRLEAAIAAGASVGVPTIVLFEMRYGIAKSARAQEAAIKSGEKVEDSAVSKANGRKKSQWRDR